MTDAGCCDVFAEKLRRDLLQVKEETHTAIQEGMAFKQQAGKMECELEGARDHIKMYSEQLEQQETLLGQLQQELNLERSRHQESNSSLQQSKKSVARLQDELDTLQKRERDAQTMVRACECVRDGTKSSQVHVHVYMYERTSTLFLHCWSVASLTLFGFSRWCH